MTIWKYECKRLLWNKFFCGFVLIVLFYGWQVLSSVTILGVSHTAPFSPWSFGDYLCRMIPLLWMGTLLLLTFFTSGKARRVGALTDAAPVAPRRYALARCAAALTGALALALGCILQAAVFYGWYFDWYGWGTLALPALLSLLPVLMFALGSGWVLGQTRPWLLYVWMLPPFLCRGLPLPGALGIWSGAFFSGYPLTLENLDPAWSVPAGVLAAQCGLCAVGAALLAVRPVCAKRSQAG